MTLWLSIRSTSPTSKTFNVITRTLNLDFTVYQILIKYTLTTVSKSPYSFNYYSKHFQLYYKAVLKEAYVTLAIGVTYKEIFPAQP